MAIRMVVAQQRLTGEPIEHEVNAALKQRTVVNEYSD